MEPLTGDIELDNMINELKFKSPIKFKDLSTALKISTLIGFAGNLLFIMLIIYEVMKNV